MRTEREMNMSASKRYTIEVSCRDQRWWRYNVDMMCGAFDEEGQRIGFTAASSRLAEVGANLKEPPTGVKVPTKVRLETDACATARCLIYILPHSLPTEPATDENAPLPIVVQMGCNGQPLRQEEHEVNPWGGGSFSFELS